MNFKKLKRNYFRDHTCCDNTTGKAFILCTSDLGLIPGTQCGSLAGKD